MLARTKGTPGTWRKMEDYLHKLKNANPSDTFKLEIVPVFPSGSKRPKEFRVQISKNGTPASASVPLVPV